MKFKSFLLFALCFVAISFSNELLACGSACCQKGDVAKKEEVKSCCSKKENKDAQSTCNTEKAEDTGTQKGCCSKKGKSCDGSCKNEGCNCTSAVIYYLNSNQFPTFSIASFQKIEDNLWSYLCKIPNPVELPIWEPPKIRLSA